MIEISNLYKTIGTQTILEDINLSICQGEILVILGASGAGKSVLLQHLIGLMKPTSGTITIDEREITQLAEKELLKIRRNIGYLFQDGALYDFMNVFDNVAFPLREHTRRKQKDIVSKVKQLLETVGLSQAAQKYPSELSGGMRKRAALARSVVMDSKILFCDEPTSGLDPILSHDISELIRSIARKFNCTTVIASHDIPNSLKIADRLAMIKGGKLITVANPKELQTSKDPYVQEFLTLSR